MFTGMVKLAQIDDYITPSKKCIQPKIIKQNNQQKATVTLNDCLACSGCITSAQTILIQQMSPNKFIQLTKSAQDIYIVISPQSLLSLSKYYQTTPQTFLHNFTIWMQKHFPSIKKIVQLSSAIKICHQLIFQQYTQRNSNKKLPILCSQCPAWVCYVQKTQPQQITQLLSSIKSPQQISSQIIHLQYGINNKIISIMSCPDKKLQSIRFFINNFIQQIDLTLTTSEIVELVNKVDKEERFLGNLEICGNSNIFLEHISFVKDQTSNGYLEYILDRLGIKDYKCTQIRNSDFKQYSFELQGVPSKMAKCYGFRNIENMVKLIKQNKCPYLYIQIMTCPGGCFGGGGQILYKNVKNKEIIGEFQQMLKKYVLVDASTELSLKNYQINKQQAYVKYKPIEKKMIDVVMNW